MLLKKTMLCVFIIFVLTTNVSSWVVDDDGCRTPDGGRGICVRAILCGPMINFLASSPRPYSLYVRRTFQSYLCGSVGGKPKVCCSLSPIPLVPQKKIHTPQDMKKISKPNATLIDEIMMKMPDEMQFLQPKNMTDNDNERIITSHRNFDLLPQEECGLVGLADKISQGKNATLGEFPWMALLSYKIDNRTEFRCGGTIINDRYILTAAHCIKKQPLYKVRVGEYEISKEKDCVLQENNSLRCAPPVQDLRIEEIIPHPKFTMDLNNKDGVNDIGLLRVSPIKMNGYTTPICLPNGEIPKRTPKRLVISGWGFTEKSSKTSRILQKASLKTLQMDKCQMFYERRRVRISPTQVCVNKGYAGSCMGDSGGPLQTADYIYDDIRSIQYGIISFGGANCGSGVNPGIYTRVSSYMNWILDNIKP